jgi:hypothetical protein
MNIPGSKMVFNPLSRFAPESEIPSSLPHGFWEFCMEITMREKAIVPTPVIFCSEQSSRFTIEWKHNFSDRGSKSDAREENYKKTT